MEMNIKHVHVGAEIEKRRVELGLSKSELGRRIGVPQQHVNRILERETMETNRLLQGSEGLGWNSIIAISSLSSAPSRNRFPLIGRLSLCKEVPII